MKGFAVLGVRPKSDASYHIILILSLLPYMPAGCSTTYKVVREQRRVSQLQITSDPAGATVYLDGKHRGKTPTKVELTYRLLEKEVEPGARKQGWLLLGTGGAALIGGIGVTYWGFSGLGGGLESTPSSGRILAGTAAIFAAIYGLYAVIAGTYSLVSTPSGVIIKEVEPQRVVLQLDTPGLGLREARVTPTDQPQLPSQHLPARVHFSNLRQRWEASLPDGLQLADASGYTSGPIITSNAPSATVAPALPPSESAAGSTPLEEAEIARLRKQGEASYRRRDYSDALRYFERAFALAPSPAMRFNIASALDKLGKAAQAIRQYRTYLKETEGTTSPSALAHIQKRMKTLLLQAAELQLVVEPPQAAVTIDGVPLTSLSMEKGNNGRYDMVLDPDTYRLEADSPQHITQTIKFSLTAGERKTIKVKLESR